MATRGTQFGRTMTYFREANLDEAQAALNRAAGIVNERTAQAEVKPKPQRRARKAKGNAQEQPATGSNIYSDTASNPRS